MESKSRGQNKIRKRGNSSSSSSSSVLQRYRFKRAIVVGRRGGSATPVPTWKTSTSPTSSMPNAESIKCSISQPKEASISARKLAATLWGINNISPPKDQLVGDTKEPRSGEKVVKFPDLLDPCQPSFSEKMRRNNRRRSMITQKIQLSDYNMDSVSDDGLVEMETRTKVKAHKECIGIKSRLRDVSNGITASKELLKVLNRVWGLDEQHSSAISLVSALGVELDGARVQVDQLIKDQRSNHNEIEKLVSHFEEEKAAWKSKERHRIHNAIACISEELQVEKKLRRQTERLNKKLGMELADAKASLTQTLKELESEKRAKEILDQVCEELARGIGEDRALVEELKREAAKVKEEVEKEREMLQLADVFREERVQMKLSEARCHFEEKNAALERLRHELEAYIQEKLSGQENCFLSPNYQRIKELEAYLKEIEDRSYQNVERQEDEVVANREGHNGDDSAGSDLHSIELNMDNSSKTYKWSYASDDTALDNSKQVSVDKDFKGRESISESIQWENICLQRRNSGNIDGPDNDFNIKNQDTANLFDRETLSELDPPFKNQDQEEEIVRYKSVRSLRHQILSGSTRQPKQNFASPTRQWPASQDTGSAVSDGSPELQGDNLKRRLKGTRGKGPS